MRIALVGVGVVGRYIGNALADAGHELALRDVDPGATALLEKRGARVAASAAEAAANSEMVISALPTPAEVEELTLGPGGILEGGTEGLIHVMTSTIGPPLARKLAEATEGAGQAFLDAPLSAGPQDEKGGMRLSLWAGGRITDYARARPVLETFAPFVLYCGPAGHAQIVKLINNVTTLALARVLGDTLSLGVKAGVPLETLRAALTWGTAQNRLMDESFPQSVFSGDWRPGYRLDLAEKDVRLTCELAESAGVSLPEADELFERFEAARARGFEGLSVHSIVRLAEEAAGVRLRLQPHMEREVLPDSDE
jgi:3-hydroxyisobutyrate dehydrogenase-like beta-hydroxyacid dehydrogenase